MKLSKRIILVLTVVAGLSFSEINSYANTNQDISIDPIFPYEDGVWYPGRVESKDFYITNNKEHNIKIDRLYIQLKSSKDLKTNQMLNVNSNQFKELSKNSTVKLMYKGNILFEDKLDNLIHEKGIVLSQEIIIKSNKKELLNMTIDMDGAMNNDAQSLENIFSIGVAYKVDNAIGSGGDNNGGSDSNVGGSTDNIDKLPQTGGLINSSSLLALGSIIVGAGIILNKKSSEYKGGKHHE